MQQLRLVFLLAAFSTSAVASDEKAEADRSPLRLVESVLLVGHGVSLVASIVSRKFRKIGIPLAATASAAAFALRSVRAYKKLQQSDNPTAKELRHLRFDFWFSVAAVPLSAYGILRAARAMTGGGWRMLVPFAMPKGTTSFKDKLIGASFLTGFAISRFIDWKAHEKRGINPLTSYNFTIGTVYDLAGGVLTTLALNNSATLLGRLQSAGIMSLSYNLLNVYIQEVQHLIAKSDFKPANPYFDAHWGVFVSNPRNIVTWAAFHKLASAATGVSSALMATILWKAVQWTDRIQRRVHYTNSKLEYLTTDKGFWGSVLSLSWEDHYFWRKDKKQHSHP